MSPTSRDYPGQALWLVVGVTLLLGACQASTTEAMPPWSPADVRLLDPTDAANPGQDLIAVYSRTLSWELQIRIDFLDLSLKPDYDLYLALDLRPGGRHDLPLSTTSTLAWELVLDIPAEGQPEVHFAQPGIDPIVIPRVWRDPDLDTLVVGINRNRVHGLQEAFHMEVLVAEAGANRPADRLGPVRSDAQELRQTPILLAFWHTFPAYTPAQAVRRWDGAHTGPFGERHGLRNLLAAAWRHGMPLSLLDLKTPAGLSAMDYLGVAQQVEAVSRQQYVDLPDTVYLSRQLAMGPSPMLPAQEAIERAARQSRQVGLAYGLPSATTLYSPWPLQQPPPNYRLVLMPGPPDDTPTQGLPTLHLARWRDARLVLLPAVDPAHITRGGLSLDARRTLVNQAVLSGAIGQPGKDGVILMGGDLGQTAWGDPRAAEQALAYLDAHPWVRPIRLAELSALQPARQALPPPTPRAMPITTYTSLGSPLPSSLSSTAWQDALLGRLGEAPAGKLADLAWEAYISLLAPNPPETPEAAVMRASRLEPVGWLTEAAAWAANPRPRRDCDSDPDLDGLPECVLASNQVFGIIEPHGARLVLLVARNTTVDQWIATSAQFGVLLGDPGTWDPQRGLAGEPAGIAGAFQDSADPWRVYNPNSVAGGLAFDSLDGSRRLVYTLTQTGLRVSLTAGPGEPLRTQVPLVVPPLARYAPGWPDRVHIALPDPQRLIFGISGSPKLEITSNGRLTYESFMDGRAALGFPEDPNQNFPPGHFLPFPMTLVNVAGERALTVDLNFLPPG